MDISRLVLAYSIVNHLGTPENDWNWNIIKQEFIKKIENISLEIEIDLINPKEGFSGFNYLEVKAYKEALKNDDFITVSQCIENDLTNSKNASISVSTDELSLIFGKISTSELSSYLLNPYKIEKIIFTDNRNMYTFNKKEISEILW